MLFTKRYLKKKNTPPQKKKSLVCVCVCMCVCVCVFESLSHISFTSVASFTSCLQTYALQTTSQLGFELEWNAKSTRMPSFFFFFFGGGGVGGELSRLEAFKRLNPLLKTATSINVPKLDSYNNEKNNKKTSGFRAGRVVIGWKQSGWRHLRCTETERPCSGRGGLGAWQPERCLSLQTTTPLRCLGCSLTQ